MASVPQNENAATSPPQVSDPATVPPNSPARGQAGELAYRLLTMGLAAILLVLTFQWYQLASRRPPRLAWQRGDQFQQSFRVDINEGSWIEWMQLPQIGETMAHRIVADRNEHGPFQSIDDLQRVPGIGAVTLERLRPWLTGGPD